MTLDYVKELNANEYNANEPDLIVDMDAYNRCMAEQQKRSRSAMKFNVGQSAVNYDGAATEFVGYQFLKSNAVILSISINGEAGLKKRAPAMMF